jgi:hypothetical protein
VRALAAAFVGALALVLAVGAAPPEQARAQAGVSYAIPPDNPFVNTSGARGEVYAFGMRNPSGGRAGRAPPVREAATHRTMFRLPTPIPVAATW